MLARLSLLHSPAKLAEIMNNFVDKISAIRQGLPSQTDDPLRTLQKIMKDRNTVFSLSCVHPDAVRKIIVSLKNSKSSGYIDLLIKECMYTYPKQPLHVLYQWTTPKYDTVVQCVKEGETHIFIVSKGSNICKKCHLRIWLLRKSYGPYNINNP